MQTDCKTEIGITVGLIDGIISITRILVDRDWDAPEIQEAIKDLREDDDMKRLMDIGELSDAKKYIKEQEKTISVLCDALTLSNSLIKKK